MLTLANKRFKKLVWQLFQQQKNNLELTVNNQTENSMDVEIRIAGKNVGFRVIVISTSTNHSDEKPDPRGYGDSAAVVQAAMQNWYPGKTNHWTSHRRHFTLQAWNLPSEKTKDFTANYDYDPTNSSQDWSDGYELEKIYQLIFEIQNKKDAEFKAGVEIRYADALTDAFKKLLK